MEYIYASMLLHKAGKPITEENIKKIFSSDFSASLKFLMAGLEAARIFVVINCKGIRSLETRLDKIDREYEEIRKELKKCLRK